MQPMPRFEIEVPADHVTAFREHVTTFPKATIVFDQARKEEEEDALRPPYLREHPHTAKIEALTQPLEEDVLPDVMSGYVRLLTAVFSKIEDEEQTVVVNLGTKEDFALIQEKVQGLLKTVDHPRQAGIVIDRFGLLSGVPKKEPMIIAELEINVGRVREDQKKAFQKLIALQTDPKVFPRLIQITPKPAGSKLR